MEFIFASAAHCFHPKGSTKTNPDEVVVVLGKPDLKVRFAYEVESSIIEIVIHPGWKLNSATYDADIAIVKLAEIISYTDAVKPVRIPDQSDPISIVGHSVSIHELQLLLT